MTREVILSERNFPSGTHNIPSRLIPDGENTVTLELSRCTAATPTVWPSASVKIQFSVEASFDNGVTWVKAGGLTAEGGIKTNISGQEITKTTVRVVWPPGAGRRMRATAVITGGTLRTAISIETT